MGLRSNLVPYPTYKPSGISWLGDVPENWQVRRLRDSTNYCVNGVWGNDPDGNDDLPCVRVADFDRHRLRVNRPIPTMRSVAPNERRRRMLRCGDLLLEKSGGGDQQPVGVVMLFDHEVSSVCSNFIARISVRQGFDSLFLTFLHSALYSIGLNTRSIKQTTGIQNLDSTGYLNESVAFPPLHEQRAIARYLDYVDGQIKQYVRAKERLIELLEEQKRAVINQAVTRGMDPDVPLKPSGVEWLGDVPAHWEVRRLRTLANIATGGKDTVDRQDDGRYPFFVRSQTVEKIDSWSFDGEAVLTAGDGVGVGRVFHYVDGKFDFHQRVYKFSDFRDVYGRFFFHFLSAMFRFVVSQGTAKSTVDSLRLPMLQNFPVVLPKSTEQVAIVRHLDEHMMLYDKALSQTRKQIELIKEYRTRLIADVVTGKLDVRDAVANQPDNVEDDELLGGASAVDYPGTEA